MLGERDGRRIDKKLFKMQKLRQREMSQRVEEVKDKGADESGRGVSMEWVPTH